MSSKNNRTESAGVRLAPREMRKTRPVLMTQPKTEVDPVVQELIRQLHQLQLKITEHEARLNNLQVDATTRAVTSPA